MSIEHKSYRFIHTEELMYIKFINIHYFKTPQDQNLPDFGRQIL